MPTLLQLAGRNRNWLLKWTFYPIAAYFASFIIGLSLFMPLVFVVLLVGIQWKRIERLTGNRDAVYWLFSLVVYALLTWLVWQLPVTGSEGVACYTLVYFGTQAWGELVLRQWAGRWRWGRVALANGMAAGCWLVGYLLINRLPVNSLESDRATTIWLGLGIPVLGTLGNLITGLGLLAAVQDKKTAESA